MEAKIRHVPPRASSMTESLRGLGYTVESALADLIDNSITAGSRHVSIDFRWRGEKSTITVLDDGCGMSDETLEQAMRLGNKNPLEKREENDLGRFGFGLKTAAFSQCRSLTVASRKDGAISCLRWDLDVLKNTPGDGWFLLVGSAEGSEFLIEPLSNMASGTIIVLEKLDRIVTPGFTEQNFLDLIDVVEEHLSMVFHRYLDGEYPKLVVSINGRSIRPWDPFMGSHSVTWPSPVERLRVARGEVEVQCYVLPHKERLTAEEFELGAGPAGWAGQQGFYVYRKERMLVSGSWLGLGQGRAWTKEEAHKLVRIRLDIDNCSDSEWKIDIRKSSAHPPVSIRARLTMLAEDARRRARQVFAYRGHYVSHGSQTTVIQAWKRQDFKGGTRYKIDKAHPVIRAVLDEAGNLTPQVEAMLTVIEETVPVQRIWLDTAETREAPATAFEGEPPEQVVRVLRVLYGNLVVKKGMSPDAARQQLLRTEPFNNYPEIVAALGINED